MDGNQSSRLSNAVSSGATKKRRSSILKSHRLTRTPFSELEFKVTTPTDSGKSRRVSFSKRTDVAEFITNEATTTWKNFYEKHNKSLDHSGNDSGKPILQAPGHIGQRFFEDQFQVSEIDLESNHNTTNHENLTEQLLQIACDNDRNKSLLTRQKKIDLSSATDHQTKLFGDDVTNPIVREVSGEIEINFSAVQPIVSRNDDPDEMLCNSDRVKSDEDCYGPFKIEDISCFSMGLNMTDTSKEQEFDMSITDTIHNAKVQIIAENKKRPCVKTDWAADKENVAINPYITSPKEKRYTLNKEPDKVLVFDGKKLTLQSNKELEKTFKQDKERNEIAPQRKTLACNVNNDSFEVVASSQSLPAHNFTIMKDVDLSNTGPVLVEAPLERRRTVVFHNSDGNISLTQALSTNAVLPKSDTSSAKIKTVVYEDDDCNLSMTNALPSKMLFTNNKEEIISKRSNAFQNNENVYSNSNISLTRALSANTGDHESDASSVKIKTVVYDNDDDNLSMTKALPAKMLFTDTEQQNNAKRRTVVFDNDENDISITQALPLNILPTNTGPNPHRRNTIVYENDDGEVSITEAIPRVILSDITSKTEKRRTIVFEADNDVSMTQALPANIVLNQVKRKSIFYGDDLDNISMTQAIPNNILLDSSAKIKTVVYEDDDSNLSVTNALPSKMLFTDNKEENISKRSNTLQNDENVYSNSNISLTRALSANIVDHESVASSVKIKTVVYDNDDGNLSITKALPAKMLFTDIKQQNNAKERTVAFNNDGNDISITQDLPLNILPTNTGPKPQRRKTIVYENDEGEVSITEYIPQVILSDITSKTEKRSTIVFEADNDVSMTQAVPANIGLNQVKRKSIFYGDDLDNISMTQAIPNNVLFENKTNKIFENELIENANMSITQTLVPEITEDIQEKNNRKYATIDKDVSIIETKSFHDFKNDANKLKNLNLSSAKLTAQQDFIVYQTSTNQNPPKHELTADIQQVDSRIEETPNNASKKIYFDKEPSDQEESLKQNINYLEINPEKIEVEMITGPQKQDLREEKINNSIIKSAPNSTKPMNCLINDLLDMSNASLVNKIDETVKDDCKFAILHESKDQVRIENSKNSVELMMSESIESDSRKQSPNNNDIQNVDDGDKLVPNISSESMFCVIKDSDSDIHTEPASPEPRVGSLKQEELETPKGIEKNTRLSHYIEQRSPQSQHLVEELQNKLQIIKSVVEDIPISNSSNRHYEKIICSDERLINPEINNSEGDSKKILDLLTNQTDEKDESIAPILFNSNIAIENKSQMNPTRISLPSEKSFITREELLNNISMAQALLESSCEDLNFDDTCADVTTEDNVTNNQRFSTSIKRTLHFGDESLNNIESTPLKKTAFGESSYMKEPKGNVIPSYLQDASEEIKELMHDLVKPTAEVLPFEGGLNRSLKKTISTCSNQLQVNLTTSSQVDLDIDMEVNDRSLASDRVNFGKGSSSPYPKPIIGIPSQESITFPNEQGEEIKEEEVVKFRPRRQPITAMENKESPERVLVFDQFNPLNNVLLQATQCSEVHSYDPVKPFKVEMDRNICPRETGVEVVRVSAQYNVDTTNLSHSGDECLETAESRTNSLSKSITSSLSKPMSTDQSVDVRISELRDTEVNTVIAMKENKVLLQASSSLTLVDDAISTMDIDLDGNNKTSDTVDDCVTTDSEKSVKAKKRSYSPQKDAHKKFNFEIALKPVQKMQKISYSPNSRKSGKGEVVSHSKKSDRPSEQKDGMDTRNVDMTVQQLLTEFHMHSDIDHKKINEEILDALSKSSSATMEEALSFSSSKNQIAMEQGKSLTSHLREQSEFSDGLGVVNCDSSKNLITDCDSSVNVVAKINMQPFMGHDCEWEESANDLWSFRFLRGRIRVLAQLSHRPEQAVRTHVRADTPFVLLKAEAVLNEKKNPIVVLSVQFALDAMQFILGRVQNPRAALLPALLRRCAALSRMAAQWARAMHDASVRLVYNLTHDGHFSLKVANVGLRSVWEIRMMIEMVTEGVTPWPRATDVQVVPVVVSERYSESELQRLIGEVPCDWGHVPKTIWKVFRYLKNLNKIDDLDILLKMKM